MKRLTPAHFIKVADKYYAQFAFDDKELSSGATLLYSILFNHAGQKSYCWPSQTRLAAQCKCSQRSIKAYIRQLVQLQYIMVEKQGLKNIYHLLLSPRVQNLIASGNSLIVLPNSKAPQVGANIAPTMVQNLPSIGENIAYRTKSKERRNTPIQKSLIYYPSNGLSSMGGDISFITPKKNEKQNFTQANADFERLFALWPVKQDKLACAKVYNQLASKKALPALEKLLSVVDSMKADDRRWQAGYVPNLKFWLLGKRWNDEPMRKNLDASSTAQDSEMTTQHTEKVQKIVKNLQQAIHAPKPSTELDSTVSTLQKLFPKMSRERLFANICIAKCRHGISHETILQRALSYIEKIGKESVIPETFNDWIGEAYAMR